MKKYWKWILVGLLAVTVLGCVSIRWLLVNRWTAKPPPLPADTSITRLKPETRDGKIRLGKSWAGTREGLPVIFLKGSPFEIGYAHGFLSREKMHTLENEFIEMIHGYVPQQWKIDLLKNYVIYRNRHLSDFIPLAYRTEIYATTLGSTDIHPEEGSFYNRLLNYHAAHDVSYMLIDNPLVSKAGCTAFGAWGSQTENAHLITGRNFDWEAAEVFSRDRVVIMCEPDGAIPFISLAWAGMAGVVSGMNREGVSVTVNGAPSGLPDETATPVAIVAREVLEQSHSLGEALTILRDAKVFVSTLWLVGSRADGKFVVVEKTPVAMQVREPEGDSIICANHFQTDGLKDSERNKTYMAEATSVSREDRLKELLRAQAGEVDAKETAALLRDRRLPGGTFAGDGHRGTLNALIATHATIMDLTEGIFWAAAPPNQLGKFVAFDVKDFPHELPERTLPADPMLASEEFAKAREAQKNLRAGAMALKKGKATSALSDAQNAETLNPGFYQNSFLKGRALMALGRFAEAEQAFRTALAQHPAFLAEKTELETLLQQAQKSQ